MLLNVWKCTPTGIKDSASQVPFFLLRSRSETKEDISGPAFKVNSETVTAFHREHIVVSASQEIIHQT